ncbi:hypothetical protein M422DRAFT_235742 [Sphaerobolus stellatus SS14]|uniref:Uncharacterized protein n=1 Tax=Sphaerobolus stellatus (strain SS14) TaxID=990650 RepID=A0A0C9US39_SPHS4|nr:hypothetical protein M422DRAFT_235742 [Sphaerobolus stellatus SS14]
MARAQGKSAFAPIPESSSSVSTLCTSVPLKSNISSVTLQRPNIFLDGRDFSYSNRRLDVVDAVRSRALGTKTSMLDCQKTLYTFPPISHPCPSFFLEIASLTAVGPYVQS